MSFGRAALFLVIVAVACASAEPQRRPNNVRQNLPPPPPPPPSRNNRFNSRPQSANPPFRATPANARDASGGEVYPGCNGTVCLPVAQECAVRKARSGHFTFGGKSFWFSWVSNDSALRNARWNWFTGRNYCRRMCMDMVSIETKEKENFIYELMKASGIKDVHTAGRLCDAEVDGCDQPRFKPLHVNGWFWASTLKMMPPTNQASGIFHNNWSPSGPKGIRQPDGVLKRDGFGAEACMALIDNKFNDGFRWHDVSCNSRRVLACEDLPQQNINFVRNQNPGVRIP